MSSVFENLGKEWVVQFSATPRDGSTYLIRGMNKYNKFIRNKAQTAVINMVVKRMLNNVHLLDVSYVTTYIFRSDR